MSVAGDTGQEGAVEESKGSVFLGKRKASASYSWLKGLEKSIKMKRSQLGFQDKENSKLCTAFISVELCPFRLMTSCITIDCFCIDVWEPSESTKELSAR